MLAEGKLTDTSGEHAGSVLLPQTESWRKRVLKVVELGAESLKSSNAGHACGGVHEGLHGVELLEKLADRSVGVHSGNLLDQHCQLTRRNKTLKGQCLFGRDVRTVVGVVNSR